METSLEISTESAYLDQEAVRAQAAIGETLTKMKRATGRAFRSGHALREHPVLVSSLVLGGAGLLGFAIYRAVANRKKVKLVVAAPPSRPPAFWRDTVRVARNALVAAWVSRSVEGRPQQEQDYSETV